MYSCRHLVLPFDCMLCSKLIFLARSDVTAQTGCCAKTAAILLLVSDGGRTRVHVWQPLARMLDFVLRLYMQQA